ncbi:glycoside hydrolase family 28 protein [Pleomassaria siparia CBS 279.74]|uniref:Glycoside hydrolase family 28 protein n=1 Tax=Pleomassaria siparia CBS 279.74 TaxID=1314801 RepID=A0A6G1KNT4_9PLEO|nr:glycoside hydrolase family 28 protein [Pleomassaria siparia CBS 279.74]
MFRLLPLALIASISCAATVPSRVQERATTCTPTSGTSDDTLTIQSAIAQCPSGTIVIPASTTYAINSALSFEGCSGCTLQIEGTLKVSDDTDYWNGKSDVFTLDGITGAKIYSSTGTGVIDGNGQSSWDLFATDTSYDRPTLFSITGTSKNIIVQNLLFKNAPNVFHSASSGTSNIQYIDVTLSATSESSAPAKNTDGWDVSGSYITIQGAKVTNDDDCVAFKPGANYVTVTDITCTGSHGLSVGSLGNKYGTTDTVSNIYVDGATMTDSGKAAGIKLYPAGADHGSAVVKNVTFANVVVDNSDYAFQIQSCYNEDDAYCTATPSTGQLTDIVVKGFSGTTSTKYAPVVANINCPEAGSCGLTMSEMTVKSGSGATAEYLCANTPSTVGVTCSSGADG